MGSAAWKNKRGFVVNGPTKYCFDTCAAIDFVDKDEQQGQRIWPENLEKSAKIFSVITRMELLSRPNMDEREKEQRKALLAEGPVFPLDEVIEKEAIKIRQEKKCKLPDSIVAATAVIAGAVLLTSDPHLLTLEWPGLKAVSILDEP
jgi:predicted nucleic acid-binding protein